MGWMWKAQGCKDVDFYHTDKRREAPGHTKKKEAATIVL